MAKYYKAQKYKTGQTGLMSSSYLMAELASELDSSNSVCQYGLTEEEKSRQGAVHK